MHETIESHTVSSENLTVSLLVWRRFKRPMPGLIERIYELNRDLGEAGPYLPVGTVVLLPIPAPRTVEVLERIRLW